MQWRWKMELATIRGSNLLKFPMNPTNHPALAERIVFSTKDPEILRKTRKNDLDRLAERVGDVHAALRKRNVYAGLLRNCFRARDLAPCRLCPSLSFFSRCLRIFLLQWHSTWHSPQQTLTSVLGAARAD